MAWLYYAVGVGRRAGVYDTWPECERQVKGFSGAKFKGFNSWGEAQRFKASYGGGKNHSGQQPSRQDYLRGRKPGIYSRVMVEEQVDGFPDAFYDVFPTYAEASRFMHSHLDTKAATAAPPPSDNPGVAMTGSGRAAAAPDVPYAEKYYAVAIGREPGIYYDWPTCEKQVKRYSGAIHQSFPTHAEAVKFVRERGNHFAMVAGFRPDNSAPFEDESDRFASSQCIAPGSQEYCKQRTTAITREFDVLYLSQPLLLRAFHDICREVKVEPRGSLPEYELAIKELGLINIVDFIDAKRCGKKVHIWPWDEFQAFRDYTLHSRDKCMVLDIARQHNLLRALLQNLSGKKAAKHARIMAMRQRRSNAPSLARPELSRPVPTPPAARAAASSHNAYDAPTPDAVAKRESPQSPPRPPSQQPPHTTITNPQHPPTPDTTPRATPALSSTTPVRRSARIAAIKEEQPTDSMETPVTQQKKKNKRKNTALAEILDHNDDAHDTPAAKKRKQGTPSRASVRS
ncbi:ribonuclease H-like domain-containing protein [Apiospora marii]|uniref:Ribonuclease H-like domain-containing protein n=1 Tax=Apiospora marii TaxID=335849 RepID=A0ABR1T1V2_9PEZI